MSSGRGSWGSASPAPARPPPDRSIPTPPDPPDAGDVHPAASTAADDDLVPVSVRLGQVVPPEDPEDWTRPLTWVAAAGMLAPPIVALAIFAIARPESTDADARTLVIGAALVVGANVTGATQLERAWAFAATLGAALFASLGVVLAAAGVGGTAATGQVAPPVAHAVVAVLLGLAGGTASALVGAAVTTVIRGVRRFAVAATAGLAAATLVAALVLGQ